ncbi:BAQ_1a_G0043940.mRNA.1.CDS.1 [Saccharomyces cerevisiae]|nr:BAQ_1a_G0043940.mRNA.1.CDS.1 [Saccharomyces cerevisiae]CAI4731433.1 BAM_G0043930.mRNA.1.CDS.1 [Saccharomyces cerevisiae]CAI7290453.1 BAM_G0043930.mRNA.1.CDS.1 [Saccharomyces cerevisiae]CAI7292358.1 BAQ_1a_G0043940.mRNA.1.CDS.1 [Saccharomyces cerevisiae]
MTRLKAKYSPTKGKRKEDKHTKRMRKSSFTRTQKMLEVFNDNRSHFNKYESLGIDVEDDDTFGNLVLMENDKSDVDIPVIEEVTSSEDEQRAESSKRNNSLEDNQDFIAFSDSSEDETEQIKEDDDERSSFLLTDEHEVSKLTSQQSLNTESACNVEYPWIRNHCHSKQRRIADWLTSEIKDFVHYISPSKNEIKCRNRTIDKLRRAVKELWSDADLHVFGSFATDLYLPGSDIDCVVNSRNRDKEDRNYIYELARHLKNKGLAIRMEVIVKTRVPIIKFIEPQSQLHIDVSFERTNGLEAAKLIREWLRDSPGLRELVLIIKQFLHSRRLNNVHTGGLGGFTVICLVYSFLNMHPRIKSNDIDVLDNLGVLLIDFFELYGKNFGYDDVAISISDGYASYIPKSCWRTLEPSRSKFSLAIQDPGDPNNNISRGSFNMKDIKKAFAGAFELLVNKCWELNSATFKDRVGKSILGNVIKYRGLKRDFNDERDLVQNKAIIENERYHKRRTRIVQEDLFINDTEDLPVEEIYKLDEPAKKKQKAKKDKREGEIKKSAIPSPPPDFGVSRSKMKRKEKKTDQGSLLHQNNLSIDDLMGLSENDQESDQGQKGRDTPSGQDEKSPLETKTVDAQTRRDYWLSKGQAL